MKLKEPYTSPTGVYFEYDRTDTITTLISPYMNDVLDRPVKFFEYKRWKHMMNEKMKRIQGKIDEVQLQRRMKNKV